MNLVDDLDGSTGSDISPVRFGLDGVDYTIDLTASNAAKLRDLLEPYVASARRARGSRKARAATARVTTAASARTTSAAAPTVTEDATTTENVVAPSARAASRSSARSSPKSPKSSVKSAPKSATTKSAQKAEKAEKPASKTKAKAPKAAEAEPKATNREEGRAIREWAAANGHAVAERGRIPTNVVTAYHLAHQPDIRAAIFSG
ncbi:Lsr2 protein [Streptoalloteichus tenebrarius]|uniref:Lsr2 protein n=1 Tax=Streptoalloteichus tenebrarius (strain ATCC 17920 / DSM 40477 / JCM 4838 / CBS 697.72 / NBRC 16177 / NCIMB 11028 / NRRL B-12390 / A12253. 1 / ISP 5477) TaxID=1933 RepID=A0ABT1HM38_STRSD|nr:Lsr2 protein [Streptoalloteichus tenebrarius]BFF04940.1 hypothetical protein GCM10020241_66150 [Streptoalloteichus tenebrarius]